MKNKYGRKLSKKSQLNYIKKAAQVFPALLIKTLIQIIF
jgi:hypothetical protein